MARKTGPVIATETEGPQPLVSTPYLSSSLGRVVRAARVLHPAGRHQLGRGDLNCGLGADDDPSHVDENRRRVRDHLSAQGLVSLTQTHSAQVHSLAVRPTGRAAGGRKVTALSPGFPGWRWGCCRPTAVRCSLSIRWRA